MTLRFGTDGVRGHAETELTPELVVALGRAAARVLGGGPVVIGRDTRASGPRLEAELAAGLVAEGLHVDRVGVVPTPAVAHASATQGVTGAMISASHNAYEDNGIKFFAPGGTKLSDEVEERLEAELDALLHEDGPPVDEPVDGPADLAVGRAWVDSVVASVPEQALAGLRLVVDCANGAASAWAPDGLRRLGAEVDVIHDQPDGTNINARCGSTHPEDLQARVLEVGADAGLAFDGDADRVLAVDADGALVDGDHLIAICAADRHLRGALAGDTVVVTVMANLGFKLAMQELGIRVVETAVGDRYVLEALADGGWSLGGEQSGHVIFSELATTGDGLLTGVQVLAAVQSAGVTLAEAASVMTSLPQVLRNVPVARRDVDVAAALAAEVAAEEAALGQGRILLRPSGTEPVVRVMVEAESEERAAAAAARLAAAVERLGA
ncbi:MAG TPA: phosphoglucosamine mutase [Acidimicrobiales bacterium]|nr:phosphoglucosamine mutase [Acidimicrobiales bacterium]